MISTGGFRVTGKLATQCSLQDPLGGELTVEASSVPITSIDIHLLRVESIIVGERIVTETSLIQSTQVNHYPFMQQLYIEISCQEIKDSSSYRLSCSDCRWRCLP